MSTQFRQLAAIMFTDIVGYTALMGRDERRAFELLRKNREIHKPLIKKFHGTWIKELGDGVLASFHTVTDAVFCAAAIHHACSKVDELHLRIGIHLGEVIFENNDVFGDGVNIASRLQAMASPGSTWVSEAVYKNLVNKKEISSEFIREETLKNVSEPVKVYEISVKEIPGYLPDNIKAYQKQASIRKPLRKNTIFITAIILFVGIVAAYLLFFNKQTKQTAAFQSTGEKSIAVLPFVNMSNDKEQEYFSDGITEDIITQVSKIGDIKVISRTAIMQYKGTKKTVKEIGNELDVSTILEGSVRRAGNQIRIVAQLINVETNEHLWAETYDKDFTQIFAIQSNVAEQIASALKTKFIAGKDQAKEHSPERLKAYDFYLRGKFYFNESTKESVDSSIGIFEQTVSIDPEFALGHAALALAYAEKFFNYDAAKKWKENAFVALEKAISLNPDLPEAYHTRARLIWTLENHFPHEQAVAALRHALSLRPNFIEARNLLSGIYSHIAIHDKALQEVQKARALNPLDLETLAQTGHQLYYEQKYSEMLAVFEKLPKKYGWPFNGSRTAEALLRTGRKNEAKQVIDELLLDFPDHAHSNSIAAVLFAAGGQNELAEQKIQTAIKNGQMLGHFHHTTYHAAVVYALMNKTSEAINWLKQTAEDGMPCYTMFTSDSYFNNLRNLPEFRSFLDAQKKQWEYYKSAL